MKKYLKQITLLTLLITVLILIAVEMNSITTDGLMKIVLNDNIHWLSSMVIVFYLLYRIYTEFSKKMKTERNFIKVSSLIILALLIFTNNFVMSHKSTLMAIRFAMLYRYVTLLGMVYIIEYYLVEQVIKKYRIIFTAVMVSFTVVLFLLTVDMIPLLSAGYYFVALFYLLLVYIKWQPVDNRLNHVRHFTILIIIIGILNDIILLVYNHSIELTFIVVALGIIAVYGTKFSNKQRFHQDKLNDIKSLKVQITKLKNENKDTEISVTRIKNELSSRFNLKQNYYENLELVIDVLNTNIIIINQDFKVELSYGNAFNYEEVVGLELSKALFDVFSDDAQYFQSVVKKVFDAKDEVRENLFLSLLDQTLTIHNMNYCMSYYVMSKHNNEKVIIMHAELQDRKNFDGQSEHDREVSEMVTAIVRNSEMFFSDLAAFIDFSKRITSYLNTEDTISENIFRILRRVHTFKGVFDQYNMYTTVRGINDIENELFNTLHNIEELTLDQFSRVLIAYDMESILRTDMMILKHQLGERFFNSRSKIQVDLVDFNRVYLDLVDEIGLDHKLTKKMEALKQVDLLEILESYREYVIRIAEDQGKLVKFEVVGDSVKVNRKQFIELFEGLIHILKNSVTHGVEYPDERRHANKAEVATISCLVKLSGRNIHLIVSDDGKGIDVKEIKNRLFIIGKYTIDELESLSDEVVCNMVIEDGVTSFMAPNSFAGRGVGMGSIKEVVENVNGSIAVKSEAAFGVTYEIIIPLKQENGIVEFDNIEILNNLCLQAERLLTKSEKKSTLSSTWYKESGVVDENLLLDVSSFISARSYRDRQMFISADEAFLYQLIGSYGLHLKYKGSNLRVMNEAICMFIEDISGMTIESLSTEQQNVKLESACIMSNKMFSETCKGHTADVADLDISEGKLRIVVLTN